ncbi:hypothetical protein KIH41_03275 [Litoribacter ruber]|uniref:Uncharacterized protein n=1 Tax=Litoribacter ruber TaxID=702568 RepID=A0AAP2CMB2_9BACT|nr:MULTISPECIES: hypothetical protein [Litoribacter]MBS9524547.1 hypothetical protein [Litoribacter alkaliphilus]MBT0810293.1 hypothetical protein [Litoribacter ruber]
MKKLLYPLLGLVVACSGHSEDSKDNNQEVNLVLKDSLQIDHLGELVLMDIDPDNDKILFFDFKTRDFIISDKQGNKLNTFNKTGDGPDSFGNFPNTPGKFNERGNFQLLSYNGIFEYDTDGNLVNKNTFEQPISYMGRSTAEWEFYQVAEDSILSVGLQAWSEHPRNTPEYYDNFKLLNWLDVKSMTNTHFMSLEENSLFRNGKGHELPDMIPAMHYEDGKIYMVVGKDARLNVYEANPPYALIKSAELDLEGFQQDPGVSFGELDPNAIKVNMETGRINSLKKYGDYLLLSYLPGFNDVDAERFRSETDPNKQVALYEELKSKYPARLNIMNTELETLKNMEMPANLNNRQFIVRNDQLWFMGEPNAEEEEDFFRVYRVEVE